MRQPLRLFRHDDAPVTVGLVVDHSGSMQPKLADVIAAARTFVECQQRDDQMFVVNFNENVSAGLPEAVPFTSDSADLDSGHPQRPGDRQDALYDAVSGRG